MKIGSENMEQKKMSLARFYVPLLIILSLSVLILSLSYSKESGNTDFAAAIIKESNLKECLFMVESILEALHDNKFSASDEHFSGYEFLIAPDDDQCVFAAYQIEQPKPTKRY